MQVFLLQAIRVVFTSKMNKFTRNSYWNSLLLHFFSDTHPIIAKKSKETYSTNLSDDSFLTWLVHFIVFFVFYSSQIQILTVLFIIGTLYAMHILILYSPLCCTKYSESTLLIDKKEPENVVWEKRLYKRLNDRETE